MLESAKGQWTWTESSTYLWWPKPQDGALRPYCTPAEPATINSWGQIAGSQVLTGVLYPWPSVVLLSQWILSENLGFGRNNDNTYPLLPWVFQGRCCNSTRTIPNNVTRLPPLSKNPTRCLWGNMHPTDLQMELFQKPINPAWVQTSIFAKEMHLQTLQRNHAVPESM